MQQATSIEVIFGWDSIWFAGVLFALTYLIIVTDRINRAIVALFSASLMILGGVLTQKAAMDGVDFNTLGLLTGMMVIVAITRRSGVFQFLAVWSAKQVKADPWGILVMLVFVTALLSALLDNVTTVLLIAPVTLLISEALRIKPYPFLFAEIFASNIGGAATLIGDPPNIMIGSAVNLSFNDFLFNLGPPVVIVLIVTLIPFYLIWGRSMHATQADRQRVLNYNEWEAITDSRLLWQSLFVISLVLAGFVVGHHLNFMPASIAMFGAALLLLLDNLPRKSADQIKSVHTTFSEVEWVTIFFFLGLFIIVHGIESTGLLSMLADNILEWTSGDSFNTSSAILWGSAVASALVDNIPFVAAMIPLIKSMGPSFGGQEGLMPLWWSLALGSCFGGNGSLIGASANLIVAGFAERSGHPISFLHFILGAFPLMLLSILISNIYIYLRYF